MAVKLVKSVKRTIEILELFEERQKPMPAVEIAEELGYPLASTHEILKTLFELGYLNYGMPKWAYVPSRRFSTAVDWVHDLTNDYGRLLDFMAALNDETLETINLSRRTRQNSKFIKGYESQHEIGVKSRPGTTMPVTQSLTGIVSLAPLGERELATYLANLKEFDPKQYAEIDRPLIDDILNEVRAYGSSTRCDVLVEGIGAVCFPVMPESSDEVLVVGIAGPSERIRQAEHEHRKTARKLAKQYRVRMPFPIKLN